MDFVAHHSGDDQVCAIEHQLFATPFVNLKFAGEDSGAGKSQPDDVDSDAFRHRLWNAAMDGDYPTYFNSGTAGAGNIPVDAQYLDSPGAKAMTAWYNFFAGNRHWELEPYFDVDGGRGVALEDVEYIVYVEKPGPGGTAGRKPRLRRGLDQSRSTARSSRRRKTIEGEHFTGEPPDRTHDWVLHVSREGHKEGMLKSYKFESRRIEMQVVEQSTQKVPFEIAQPAGRHDFARQSRRVRRKDQTRDARHAQHDVAVDGRSHRRWPRLSRDGDRREGHAAISRRISPMNYPAVMDLRLYGMNANGKVYSVDKTYQLDK